ncbi:hypothetical protein SBP8a_238 [Bacillus phage SBP8a]|nr:hypothetical protein SBP8a_238 [Bacillus phage SBP8a]
MGKPHVDAKYFVEGKVTETKEVFNKRHFNVGEPVIIQSYTSGPVAMRWEEEYGIINEYNDTRLIITTVRWDGGHVDNTILLSELDDTFNVIPIKLLLEELTIASV